MNKYVVFDTNAYRNIAAGLTSVGIEDIVRKETSKGLEVLANPYVIMELASHLWDNQDPDYSQCRSALSVLYKHCGCNGGQNVRIIADGESLLAYSLYHKIPSEHESNLLSLANLVKDVAQTTATNLPAGIITYCKGVAEGLEKGEAQFVEDMKSAIHSLDPSCSDWHPFADQPQLRKQTLRWIRHKNMSFATARTYVLRVRRLLKVREDAHDLEKMAEHVQDRIRPTIELYRLILDRIAATGCNISKPERANWYWDMQVMVGVGEVPGKVPQQVTLVTTDGDLIEAAKRASVSGYVKTLADYLKTL